MSDFENEYGSSDRAGKSDAESFSLNFISNATIAKILIEKDVCSRAELVAAEQKYRELRGEVEAFNPVHIEREASDETHSNNKSSSWVKRKMSKRRWSRKLGTALFGWQWKKTKISIPGQLPEIKRSE